LRVADSIFLTSPLPDYRPIVFTPTQPLFSVEGVQIVGNLVSGAPFNASFVTLNTSGAHAGASFNHNAIVDVVVADNALSSWDVQKGGASPKATRATALVEASNTSVFVANMSAVLLFQPTRLHSVQYSLELPVDDLFVPHGLVSTSGGTVVVHTQRVVAHGVIRVSVDQSS
jgi:hypothetical protein